MRNSHILSVSMVAIAAVIASPAVAAQSTVRNFNVPRQAAATGLVRFAQQAGCGGLSGPAAFG